MYCYANHDLALLKLLNIKLIFRLIFVFPDILFYILPILIVHVEIRFISPSLLMDKTFYVLKKPSFVLHSLIVIVISLAVTSVTIIGSFVRSG